MCDCHINPAVSVTWLGDATTFRSHDLNGKTIKAVACAASPSWCVCQDGFFIHPLDIRSTDKRYLKGLNMSFVRSLTCSCGCSEYVEAGHKEACLNCGLCYDAPSRPENEIRRIIRRIVDDGGDVRKYLTEAEAAWWEVGFPTALFGVVVQQGCLYALNDTGYPQWLLAECQDGKWK